MLEFEYAINSQLSLHYIWVKAKKSNFSVMQRKIKNALISVFNKNGLEKILELLNENDVNLFSTGGTFDFIKSMGYDVETVESLTGHPSILEGRVKTLHPAVFGGILARPDLEKDKKQIEEYGLKVFDLVIVDLYPFEETVARGAGEAEIIEKIDIGGISLIRAAAKNFNYTLCVSSRNQYDEVYSLLKKGKVESSIDDRRSFANMAFKVSSNYDKAINTYFSEDNTVLRYGENPHQKGWFEGDLSEIFDQLHGKTISYNNLLDIDSAISLISEFQEPTFAVLKHNNPCGIASRSDLIDAWKLALEGDPVSAFGGILVCNREVDLQTAEEINKIFFEILIAPKYNDKALKVLKQKKNRIVLRLKEHELPKIVKRSILNGVLSQEKDLKTEMQNDMKVVTKMKPLAKEVDDLLYANIICKHTKSNAMVLVKDKQLLGSGTGQMSRVDAHKHAIEKAKHFKKKLKGAVLASDAFFPFPDNVEIAHKVGVRAIIQPGGSMRDNESIEYCDEHLMSMIFTGSRHFRH